jgi:hypothetical protein
MDAEILSGLHAPNKCRSLPAKTRAAVFLENSDENKNRIRRNRAPRGSVDYWSLSEEEFSTLKWVRCPSGAEIEGWAKGKNRAKSQELRGLKALVTQCIWQRLCDHNLWIVSIRGERSEQNR